jgi:hypothetical protein
VTAIWLREVMSSLAKKAARWLLLLLRAAGQGVIAAREPGDPCGGVRSKITISLCWDHERRSPAPFSHLLLGRTIAGNRPPVR